MLLKSQMNIKFSVQFRDKGEGSDIPNVTLKLERK